MADATENKAGLLRDAINLNVMDESELSTWSSGWFGFDPYKQMPGYARMTVGYLGDVLALIWIRAGDGYVYQQVSLRYDLLRQAVDFIENETEDSRGHLVRTTQVPADQQGRFRSLSNRDGICPDELFTRMTSLIDMNWESLTEQQVRDLGL